MSKRVTRGANLGQVVESGGFGQASFASIKHIRYDSVDLPTDPMSREEQPNLGHENLYDQSDRPMVFRETKEGSVTAKIRQASSSSYKPPLVTWLESACCDDDSGTAATITAGVPTTTAITLDADQGALGRACLIYDDTAGLYWPTLAAAYAAKVITPTMALPNAPSVDQTVQPMYTMIPGVDAVSAKTLGFEDNLRADYSGTEDWAIQHVACALKSLGALTIKRGETPTIAGTFFSCKRDAAAVALGASTFQDSATYLRWNDNLEIGFATASAAGGIARATVNWEQADFNWGIDTQRDMASGATTYGSTINFHPQTGNTGTLSVTAELLKADWDRLISNTQDYKYMHFVQPSDSLTVPAFGLWIPKAYIDAGEAKILRAANSYYKGTFTFKFTAAGFGSDTSNGSRGMAPWYAAITKLV